jgi:catechol 2,3-dioxygenase-like lactoylglutathione lyase family enzyme
MIDHISVVVTDFDVSKAFYAAALAPLGYVLRAEYPASMTGTTDVAGFGLSPSGEAPTNLDLWISSGAPGTPRTHVALRVGHRRLVDAFYQAALAAGARDNGGPGFRPRYHPDYYAAFVLDPDGHNLEVVCRAPG